MKARFSNNRRLLTLAEGTGPRGFTPHRPYTVALSDQAGEVVPFVLTSERRAALPPEVESHDRSTR